MAAEYDLYEWMRIPLLTNHARNKALEKAAREWFTGHGLDEGEWRVLRDVVRERGINLDLVTDGRFPTSARELPRKLQDRVQKILDADVFESYLEWNACFEVLRKENGGKIPEDRIPEWNAYVGMLAAFKNRKYPYAIHGTLDGLFVKVSQASLFHISQDSKVHIVYPSAAQKADLRRHEKRLMLRALFRAFYGRQVLGADACSLFSAGSLAPPPTTPPPLLSPDPFPGLTPRIDL